MVLRQRTLEDTATAGARRRSNNSEESPTLELVCNGSVVQEVRFSRSQLLIGRSEDNDISIPSRFVSRHHVLLIREGSETILLDLNSTNGTFVNSEHVHKHVLANNDVITLDSHSPFKQYEIRFISPSPDLGSTQKRNRRADAAIERALAALGNALESSDTDVLPTLSDTVVGIVDDR